MIFGGPNAPLTRSYPRPCWPWVCAPPAPSEKPPPDRYLISSLCAPALWTILKFPCQNNGQDIYDLGPGLLRSKSAACGETTASCCLNSKTNQHIRTPLPLLLSSSLRSLRTCHQNPLRL